MNKVLVTSGISSTSGYGGIHGTSGTILFDWKNELMKKYNFRFLIESKYDHLSSNPTIIITDKNTNKEYNISGSSLRGGAPQEVDNYIKELITEIRQEKINNIINE